MKLIEIIELLIIGVIVYLSITYLSAVGAAASCLGAVIGTLHWLFKGNKKKQ